MAEARRPRKKYKRALSRRCIELQLFCKIRVAGEEVPQPEDESIDHEGKEIMMSKVEPLGFMEVDEDEACAAEDVDDLDTDDAADDIGEFSVAGSGKAEDEAGVEDEEFEAVTDVGDIEQVGLAGANSHDGFQALVTEPFEVHGGDSVVVAGGVEQAEGSGGTLTDEIGQRFIQDPAR